MNEAYERSQDDQLAKLQSWVFILRGRELVTAKKWEPALAIVDQGLGVVEEQARKELKKWKLQILFGWSGELLEAKKYPEAIDVIEIGLKESSDWRLNQRLGYLAQEWSRQEVAASGVAAGYSIVAKLSKRFPNNYHLRQVASGLAGRAAKELIDKKDFQGAVEIYQEARKMGLKDWKIKTAEESVWLNWARPHIEARRWEKAAEIHQRAVESLPNGNKIRQNSIYIVQEFGRDTEKKMASLRARKRSRCWRSVFRKTQKFKTSKEV